MIHNLDFAEINSNSSRIAAAMVPVAVRVGHADTEPSMLQKNNVAIFCRYVAQNP
jgi:hypothetical protein